MKLLEKTRSAIVTSKTGNTRKRHYGIFECSKCKNKVEREIYGGERALTCGEASCVDRHPEIALTPKTPPMYGSWSSMKQRCNNPNNPKYKDWGGRGITYTSDWETFEGFKKDMEESWIEGYEIDRVDNNGNYEKNNCQWLPKKENCSKDIRRPISKLDMDNNHIVTYSSVAAAVRAGEAKTSSALSRVARGERAAYNGFKWVYTKATPFRVIERQPHSKKGTGNTNHILFSSWNNMIFRYRKDVCEEWLNFDKFCEDMLDIYFTDASLLRYKVTGIFCKDNCKWVSKSFASGQARAKVTKQLDKKTKEVIKLWNTAKQAGEALGIDPSSIAKVCKGKKLSAGGFCWEN